MTSCDYWERERLIRNVLFSLFFFLFAIVKLSGPNYFEGALKCLQVCFYHLTLSWRRPLSYRNQSIQVISVQCCISFRNQSFALYYKSNDWFLHEMENWAEAVIRYFQCYFLIIFSKIF